ncbi:GtrA family protein [Candidatus Peribacteria bacterium]|nr:GtrA family protein [Candidatus Peribacteria bacterium]
MRDTLKRHAHQILLYLISGGASAVVEIGVYLLLLRWHVWYITASVAAFFLSYITAFALHKYIVFRKPEDFIKHLKRHLGVEGFNVLAGNALLFLLVEHTPIGEEWGKILTMGLGAAWNFVLFKFLVFV